MQRSTLICNTTLITRFAKLYNNLMMVVKCRSCDLKKYLHKKIRGPESGIMVPEQGTDGDT